MSAYAIPEVLTPEAVARNKVTLAANDDLRQSANQVYGAGRYPHGRRNHLPRSPQGIKEEDRHNLPHFFGRHLLGLFILGFACSSAFSETLRVTKTPEAAEISTQGGVLTIQPIIDGAIRVRFSKSQNNPAPSVILVRKFQPPNFTVEEDRHAITVSTSKLRVILDRVSLALIFSDGSGKILLQEKPGRTTVEAGRIPMATATDGRADLHLSVGRISFRRRAIPGWLSERQGVAAEIDTGQYADRDSFSAFE